MYQAAHIRRNTTARRISALSAGPISDRHRGLNNFGELASHGMPIIGPVSTAEIWPVSVAVPLSK